MGIDLHKKQFTTTILDENGDVVSKSKVRTDRESIKGYFEKIRELGEMKGVVEATFNWSYFFDEARDHFQHLILSHPKKTRAIAEARIKTDSIDSEVLANLLRADLIPEAYVPSRETREVKNLIRYRISLVKVRTSLKNRVHKIVDRNHIDDEIFKMLTDKFGKRGMKIMRGLEIKGNDQNILRGYLDLIEKINTKIKEVEKKIKKIAEEDTITKLLKTIPGIGNILALLIRYEIDEIERFSSAKKLYSYAGLIPSTYSSGERIYHGRITKQGNKYLRWAMTEAAQVAAMSSSCLRRYYVRIKSRKGPNAAIIALARKLLGIVYCIWNERRPYREVVYD
jgi:transposase